MELINRLVICAALVYVLVSAALGSHRRPVAASATSAVVDDAVKSIGAIESRRLHPTRTATELDASADRTPLDLIEREIAAQVYLAEVLNVTAEAAAQVDALNSSDRCVAFTCSLNDTARLLDGLIRVCTDLAMAQAAGDENGGGGGGDNDHNNDTATTDAAQRPTASNGTSQQVLASLRQRLDYYRLYSRHNDKHNVSLGKLLERRSNHSGALDRRQDLIRLNGRRTKLSLRLYRLLGDSARLYADCTDDLSGSYARLGAARRDELDALEFRMSMIPLDVSMDLVGAIAARAADSLASDGARNGSTLAASFARVVIPIAVANEAAAAAASINESATIN